MTRYPILHTPPPPGYAAAAAPAPVADGGGPGAPRHDPVAASVRNQVVDRMVRMSRNHATHAWENRRSQPVCPHAIGFLFADPVPRSEPDQDETEEQRRFRVLQFFTVAAATRMVNDSPDVRDLPQLLFRLTTLARERYLPTPGGFDPAVQMAIHRDRTSGRAQYIGLGVSTLDTLGATWDEALGTAMDVDDIPGRCFALLADNTAIVIDRGASRRARKDIGVHATTDLNYAGGLAPRLWTHHPTVSTMPAPSDVWDLMNDLHQLTFHQRPRPTL